MELNRLAVQFHRENLLVAYGLDRFPNRQVFPPAWKTV